LEIYYDAGRVEAGWESFGITDSSDQLAGGEEKRREREVCGVWS
jgi:hypothetical protein